MKLQEKSASLTPTCCKERGIRGAVPELGLRYGGQGVGIGQEGGTDDDFAARVCSTPCGHRQ